MSINRGRVTNKSWIANILLPLTAVLMEAMWVYPWLALAGRWPIFIQRPQPPLSLVSLLFLLGSSFLITRFSLKRRWTLRWKRLCIMGCGILAILAVLRVEYPAGSGMLDGFWFVQTARLLISSFSHPEPMVIALFASLYLWWAGIRWGHSSLDFDNIYRAFLIGLAAQVILIISWGSEPTRTALSGTGIYIAGFFFFALSAMALARLRNIQERAEEKTIVPLLSRRWLSVLTIIIGSIILVGIGVASIFSTGFLSVFGHLFNLIAGLLYKIMAVFVAIISFFMAISFFIIQTIINMLTQEIPTEVSSSGNATIVERMQPGVSPTIPPEVMVALQWTLLAIVIVVALFLLTRAISRLKPKTANEGIEEIHESLWSREGFLADIRLFFRLLWQGFSRQIKKAATASLLTGKPRQVVPEGRLSIREIYQHLLWQAAQLGIVRQQYETAYEYSRRLSRAIPDGQSPLNELTELYVSVRYGDLTAEIKQVDDANNLWQIIRNLLGRFGTDQTTSKP